MSYKVIQAFTDLQDFNHVYSIGDDFPRAGMSVSEERIKELASGKNKQGKPLIANKQADFSECMNPPEELLEPVLYTKTEINRMSTAELRRLAADVKIKNAENTTGTELKRILINAFGL